jgi:two-component system phosphate regulon sensor histidine kinase PhoR
MLLVVAPYASLTLEQRQTDALAERLLAEARSAGAALPWTTGPALEAECTRLATELGVRLTLVGGDGRLLCDSKRPPDSLDAPGTHPEVLAALAEGSARSVRFGASADTRLLYVAWRQGRGEAVRVVRVAVPITAVEEGSADVRRVAVIGFLAAALLALATAALLSRGMLRRIRRLVGFAQRVAAGVPAPYLAAERRDDLGMLEAQLAAMARGVAETIAQLRLEQERLEAILRGMVEGVLVSDLTMRVVLLNARARELLAIPAEVDGRGRALVELVRDLAFQELAHELRAGAPVVSRDIALGGGDGHILQVNAGRLSGEDGEAFGFVLVLHDVTELRRLEVVRRDFVANVSHELRTPLTAIKGYAETLLGSAGNDRETARRFLEVIDRHSERLGRLTDDLLTLSDLELGRTSLHLAPVEVSVVVDDVLQILSERASRAGVRIGSQVVPGTPAVLADGDRLRQVLINLVDNAIKYTSAGGHVAVRAGRVTGASSDMVEIAVEDDGIGIPAQDLPRLTERFFRVDKARSRALGGTGLGLAIVKHIVQAHGGRLEIASAVGQGTTVRVILPAVGVEVSAGRGVA